MGWKSSGSGDCLNNKHLQELKILWDGNHVGKKWLSMGRKEPGTIIPAHSVSGSLLGVLSSQPVLV